MLRWPAYIIVVNLLIAVIVWIIGYQLPQRSAMKLQTDFTIGMEVKIVRDISLRFVGPEPRRGSRGTITTDMGIHGPPWPTYLTRLYPPYPVHLYAVKIGKFQWILFGEELEPIRFLYKGLL
jgi:hypothetical protein